ncbi:hypothetical protein [Sulfuriflexus mobilis]|uniref:hypothetical protein n=1 Tax=Sulfuriflexus mobilis TaxID=1811807 RepID=UPI000F84652F|nr:hypothetical protein [Sulfuriflexus mobilis]
MKYIVFQMSLVLFSAPIHAETFQCPDQTIPKDGMCQDIWGAENNPRITGNADKISTAKRYTDYASPLGKNLLKNSMFSNKLVDWKVPVGASWEPNQGVLLGGALVIQAEIPPEDKYIHETTVEQCVLLGPGDKFQLKAQFKVEQVLTGKHAEKAGVANRANVIWYESTDCTTGGQYGWFIAPKNEYGWQSLIGRSLTPAFKARAAKITLVQNGRYSRGYKGYWDNISFAASEILEQSDNEPKQPNPEYTLALNENYVRNGEFDKDMSSWRGWKAGWSLVGNTSPGSAKVSFETKESGFGAGALDQCVNIGRNMTFELGASVKKDELSTQMGGGRIRVSWNAKENCTGRSKTDGKSADINKDVDGWQHLKVKGLVAPTDTHSVHIELIQSIAGPGRFSVYWDDVYFKAVR